ncbi:peptidylprolyl isomerase [Rhodococcus antarcticus]|uniref:Peptidylprolyl isomerase n=1 Tax=Rhodococcus antarcticus TaxID=2987751 RepID=A0ABY6P4E3_9NOCA|nr:peptidylprolyl isomerase [Rhodococcus antarcticus]UZJ26549.1 peptidylprolyl isomerase [Rhodococcus antarcticus]
MPTNEQRRQAAKRKLERQLERRQERAKKRRQLAVALSAVAVVVVAGLVVLLVTVTRGGGSSADTAAATSTPPTSTPATTTTGAAPAAAALPTGRATALPATVDCTYAATAGQPASKPNTPPGTTGISTEGTVAVTMATSAGDIGLTLDRALAPCTVNSFLSLVSQQYFDSTPCHRLTTTGIKVLQCGDPTGTGQGGPGYSFANEFPTDQLAPGDAALSAPATYPRGSIAMANSGPDTNGSQFFLVYDNSPLPPGYTLFGTISDAGLAVLDKVAAAGSDGSLDPSPGGGKPNTPVTITTMTAAA